MQSPKADCESLMDYVLPFAERTLLKHGAFFPFGGALTANGEIAGVGVYDGREQPPSNDVILLLKQAFLQGAKSGEYKATALVYDVRVTLPSSDNKSDAIAVSLNHKMIIPLLYCFLTRSRKVAFNLAKSSRKKVKLIFLNPGCVHDEKLS
jgi:hypothetical protein